MTDKIDLVKQACLQEKGKNPVEIALKLMSLPGISVHGPEHHIIDGAAFLTAMHNAGAEFNLPEALNELEARGRRMPGAICGQWGICGASASVGAALAIIHGTGPLSDCEYYKDNLKLTSSVLSEIAEVGGPRCCKRNAFISLKRAVEFVNKKYGYDLEDVETDCSFSRLNPQCIRERCPFYKSSQRPDIIIICGLNGAGKSTLAKALAQEINYRFIDIEDLYFPKDNSEYMYSNPRSFDEVESILSNIVSENGKFILASVRENFKEDIVSRFKCVIHLDAPKELRIKRVYERSYNKFGERMCKDGDLYEKEQAFFDFVRSRDESTVENWLATISCPIIKVDGTLPIADNVKYITEKLRNKFHLCER